MSTPYQKVQPHFPNLSMQEIECLLGDTWDFYCERDTVDPMIALVYIAERIGSLPECCVWSEEKWLYEIHRLQESRRSELTQ